MISKNTIFALSSGSGRAGIAVIRVSGPSAAGVFTVFDIVRPAPRLASVRRLKDSTGDVLDEALVLWCPGPSSATGEDMVELHVHGSTAVVEAVFEQLSSIDGFGLAEPGAFTFRAFRNQKLDLLQVEGLADVLAAESSSQRRLAMRQFLGESSSVYESWRGDILRALALVEAAIDFSDEQDVVTRAFDDACEVMERLCASLAGALEQSARASAVRRGLRLVLAGAPNVGKSTLLNWLVDRDAAIVSPVAGTTRDVVEATMVVAGVPVLISDTAGLRQEAGDAIEREGIARTVRAVDDADILVWVAAVGQAEEATPPRRPDIFVLNKVDQDPGLVVGAEVGQVWPVSAKSGEGLTALRSSLTELIRSRNHLGEDAVVVRERHRHALLQCLIHLRSAQNASAQGLEFVAEDMRRAALSLALVTGRVDVEDLLGQIFKDFCIGK